MNKFLLTLFLLSYQLVSAQVISINPNSADNGQTLNTTITLASGIINLGSPPMQYGDVYLKKGNTIITATNFSISTPPVYDDTVNANFSIPAVIQPGLYDVHIITSQTMPFPPYYQMNDNVLTNGFTINPAVAFITGNVYFDLNQNGIKDPGEYNQPNVLVHINPGNFSTLTDTAGNYSFNVDSGIYSISITTPANFTLTSTPSVYNITVPPDSSGNDFGLYTAIPSPLTQNFFIYTHAMRCISKGYSGWNIQNTTPVVENGTITIIHSPNLSFYNSTIPPTSTNGDTLVWNYTINPHTYLSSQVVYNNPPAGDTIWYVIIDSVFDANGVFQQMYMDSYSFIVSCSVDPNDKHVSPEGEGPLHLTLKDAELTYLINFQNTGTDTAFNVQILDTLDANLDQSSIELLGSSDPVYINIQQNGAIRFTFDNIMLPDSNVDEPGSHGYVIYRINPLPNLPDSTVIENTAYIYFDFNAPVVTNTAFNRYVSQLPVSVQNIQPDQLNQLYPNPVTQTSCLYVPKGNYHLNIYDVSGRELVSCSISGKYLINKSEFVEGVYFYRVTNSDTSMSGKFIVVK